MNLPPFHWWRTVFYLIPAITIYTIVLGTLSLGSSLFEQRGYGAVSMGDVAVAAEVTRGLVHHYFGSKRELYLEVVRELLSEAPTFVPAEPADSVEDMVRRNAHALLDYLASNRGMLLANHLGSLPGPPEARLVIRAFMGLVESASREWLFHERATRAQVEALVAESILALMRDALPAVVAAGERSAA